MKKKTAIAEFREGLDKSYDQTEETTTTEEIFVKGDLVKLKNGTSSGEVLELLDKNNVILLSGTAKIKISTRELVRVNTKDNHYQSPQTFIEKGTKREIDVRGMSGDEAINAIEKHLDDAIVSGLTQVIIIHGKGTGALRKHVNTYLKNNPRIVSFRAGEWNEGGIGVTIAEIR